MTRLSWLAFLLTAACGTGGGPAGRADADRDAIDPVDPTDAPVADAAEQVPSDADTGPAADSTTACPSCPAGKICSDGACIDVPEQCPCPRESYCDLESNRCVAGCLEDDQCAPTGRICEPSTRQCRDGCRTDEKCGPGRICALGSAASDASPATGTCRPGCRSDQGCEIGQICEDRTSTCRVGCRTDESCGPGRICSAATSTCITGCRQDSECPEGQACAQNVCRVGCRSQSECGERFCSGTTKLCTSFVGSGSCLADAHCSSSATCDLDSLRCVRSLGPSCPNSKACGPGRLCRNNSCSTRSLGASCGAGSNCGLDGYCAPWQLRCRDLYSCSGGCPGGGRCANGQTAQSSRTSGQSYQYCDGLEFAARECANDAACSDGRICISGTCSMPIACKTSEDCPSTHAYLCGAGACRPYFDVTCASAADCGRGFVCNVEVGRCARRL
jgi:hypothetical protein